MGSMSAAMRNSLPDSKFGLPGSRKYPIPNRAHAMVAKGGATEMENKGKLSPASAAKIRAKANRVMSK